MKGEEVSRVKTYIGAKGVKMSNFNSRIRLNTLGGRSFIDCKKFNDTIPFNV